MSYNTLRPAIKTLLNTITKLQVVVEYPVGDIAGYPAAVIVPQSLTSDYSTNVDNERIYFFTIYLLVKLNKKSSNDAYAALYDLIDDVIDAFDNDRELVDSGLSLPANKMMIGVKPVPISEFVENTQLGTLAAPIELKCMIKYAIT